MMRFSVGAIFLFCAVRVQAQDAGLQAVQMADQANQLAQMAAQQALQTQMAMQQELQNAQQMNETVAQGASQAICCIAKPQFSIKAGTYPATITLRMTAASRGSIIYYTTDGWTPTALSTRYTGPITVSSTTNLQAIAVSPNQLRSPVVSAMYVIRGSARETVSSNFPANAPGNPLVAPGARLPLVFTAHVTSKGLRVGDELPVALAQDLIVGGEVLAAKSTPVVATVTQVDDRGRTGLPGVLTFAVHSVTLNNGTTLLLSGTRTKEGHPRAQSSHCFYLLPARGLFIRGEDADILPGTPLTAVVRSATGLQANSESLAVK